MGSPASPHRLAAMAAAEKLQATLGDRVLAIALFGSVATGRERLDSDVDLLVVAREPPVGPSARYAWVASACEPAEEMLRATRPHACLSPIVKSVVEVERGGPLYYDMTVTGLCEVLYDPTGYFADRLQRLRDKMATYGSRRVASATGQPMWILHGPQWRTAEVDL